MAETNYLSVYKQFFLEFAATVNPDDQLPVKVASYCICDNELRGEIVDWILQYLSQKRCPSTLIAPLAKIVVAEITEAIKRQPEDCGYRKEDKAYQPLKLMQAVTAKVNDVCLRYLDPEKLASLPEPLPELATSVCSIKNTRRRMEDRHTVIDDFHSVFGVKDAGLASYYGVFDGHAGTDAAVYGVSHLHQFLAESQFYPSDPERALKEAFLHTDTMFLEKSERDNLRSGTTVLCALLQHDRRMIYVGWLGDSQAILVRRGVATQLVDPHKPSRIDERKRIEDMGGCVMYWGMWRVNGQLAVSRAIGDLEYKPYVSADADVVAIPIEDDQDFVILACDGLWDFVSEQQATVCVYETIRESPGDLEAVSASLVRLSKLHGSVDNISVIVAFLTPPDKLASLDVWPSPDPAPDAAMDPSTLENGCLTPLTPEVLPNGTHGQTNGSDSAYQKASFQLDLGNGKCQPMTHTDEGKEDTFDEDDFGPETDVDALDGGADVDDVLMSPTIAAEKAAAAAFAANLSTLSPQEQHLAAIEADLELQRQQLSVFDPVREPREETPTPPADDVIGEAGVELEADNVAESGEESEDEWNFYRVDPSEKKPSEAAVEGVVDSSQPAEEDDESMESRLNPNAAEFVPSPTSMMPSMEEVLSASPFKGKVTPMDNVFVPTASEFQRECNKRPSDLHEFSNPFLPSDVPNFGQNIPDFGQNIPEFGQNIAEFGQNIADFGQSGDPLGVPDFGQNSPMDLPDFGQNSPLDVPDFVGAGENGDGPYGAKVPDFTSQLQSFKHSDHLFDKSEVSSTLAEFGDETSTSFATDDMDQKAFGTDLDVSMTQSDFLAADLPNTLDLSTEMMHSEESDAKNVQSSFFEQREASPLLSPTKVIVPELVSAPELPSPNIESGIVMDDSPVLASGMEELSLDPSPSALATSVSETPVFQAAPFGETTPFDDFIPSVPVLQSPVQQDDVSTKMDFKEFERQPDVCQITEPTALASDLDVKAPEPELQVAEPELKTTELVSQTDLEDFLSAAPTPLTNGFGSVEHAAEPDVTESITTKAEATSELSTEAVAAATAVAAVATAGVVTAAVAAAKGAKKPAVTEKAKPSSRAVATKAATSPSKPGAPQLSTTPTTKRPLAAASPTTRPAARVPAVAARPSPKAASPATKTTLLGAKTAPLASKTTAPATKTAAPAARPKPTTTVPLARPAPAAKSTTVPPRPRAALAPKAPGAAPTDKKPLTNGDTKPIAKRAEPLAARRPIAAAPAKPAPRPATAPARATRPTSTTTTTTTTRTLLATKSATTTAAKGPTTNGASKPRPATTLGATRAKPIVGAVDKQVKETANKQISQTVGKTTTVTRTTTTTARRVVGATTKPSTGSTTTTTTTKSTGPIRRPTGAAGTKSTTTTTVKTVDAPTIEPVVVEEITSTTTTIVKDDSPVIEDNNAAVVIGTD